MVTHRHHSRLFSSTPCFDPFQSIEQKTIGAVPLPQDSCCGGKKSSPQLAIFGSRPPNYYIFFLMKFLSTKSNEACKRVAKETENIKSHFNFLFYTHQLEEELQTSRRSGWSRWKDTPNKKRERNIPIKNSREGRQSARVPQKHGICWRHFKAWNNWEGQKLVHSSQNHL